MRLLYQLIAVKAISLLRMCLAGKGWPRHFLHRRLFRLFVKLCHKIEFAIHKRNILSYRGDAYRCVFRMVRIAVLNF